MLPNLVLDEEGVETLVAMLVRVVSCKTSGGGLLGASGARLVLFDAADPDDQRPVARRSKEVKERDGLGGLVEASCACAGFSISFGGWRESSPESQWKLA